MTQARRLPLSLSGIIVSAIGALIVVFALVWQALTAGGSPDPTATGLSPTAMAFGSGVLVFREGLEAVLVLAVVTAGLIRSRQDYWRSVLSGAGLALVATVVTWFLVTAIIAKIPASMLDIQAGTGLIAIAVLLVIMNWFFHKIYWTGWIGHHNARGRKIVQATATLDTKTFWALALLGFSVVYREGFEIVLFLQDLRLKAGSGVIFTGVGVGLILTGIVAALVFSAHKRLQYKKMLVGAGVLLGVVLVVMVGESVQELQLAHWITTSPVPIAIPNWIGTWFAVFPNWEGLSGQALAVLFVVGPYAWVRLKVKRSQKEPPVCPVRSEPLDCLIVHPKAVTSACPACGDDESTQQ